MKRIGKRQHSQKNGKWMAKDHMKGCKYKRLTQILVKPTRMANVKTGNIKYEQGSQTLDPWKATYGIHSWHWLQLFV